MDWPNDADGDVMRRLQKGGFDFNRETEVDFNIDMDTWPPEPSFVHLLQGKLPSATISLEDHYLVVQIRAVVTYAFVVGMQSDLSRIGSAYGGWCESWGVLWDPSSAGSTS